MKVAIDSGPLESGHKVRGIGVNTRELINAMMPLSKKAGVTLEAVDFSESNLSPYDLIHYTVFNPFFMSLPLSKKARKVILTVHDLIPLVFPKQYIPGIKGKLRFLLQKYLIRKNVDAILTISETSKKDVVRFLGVNPDHVYVVYLAPQSGLNLNKSQSSLESVKEKYKLPNKFVLYIGDINYNKNIPTLIKACKRAKLPLVIIGKRALDIELMGQDIRYIQGPRDWIRFLLGKVHPELAHYETILNEFKKNKDIIRLGFVSSGEFGAIMRLATLYCQPSLYEGFGLGVIEAMSAGLPVVSARTQALVEVGGDACIYADPKDYKDMADKLVQVSQDPKLRAKLVLLGSKRAKEFSWAKTAKETLEIYKKVANG